MASAPRPSSRPRQTWRERSRPGQPAVEGRLVKRWLSSIVFLVLVASLAWIIWQYFFAPRTHFANLSVARYTRHAVPPAPFFDNDSDFLERTIDFRKLDRYETFAAMSELAGGLNKIVLRPRDSLVLYVSAHGVSLHTAGSTEGYLLCDDFDPLKGAASGGLKIKDFLDQVRTCQAQIKIVILDAGHLPTEPRLGVIVNEFPELLAKAVRDTKDENLWVVSANSMHEASHVSHALDRSVFNYFVARGLAGDADVSPDDDVVDLAELTAFVGDGVAGWMRSQYGDLESQTPQILWGGGDITPAVVETRMRSIVLPIPPAKPAKDEKEAHEPPPSEPKTPADAPKKKAAVAARRSPPRGGGDSFGRLSSAQRAIGLLSLAMAAEPAEPQPTEQAPASEARAPAESPATSGQAPSDAKSADASSADTKKDEAETKKADPDSAPPVPAEAGKKAAPKEEPSDARNAPASKGAPKKEEREPAEPKADKWSGVRAVWALHDRRLRTDGRGDWTPIDYGPRLWRRFESAILDYEARYRYRITPAGDTPKTAEGNSLPRKNDEFVDDPDEAEALRRDGREFVENRQPAEASGPIHVALRLRNRAIYRAIDLVAWHARASCAEQEPLGEYREIADFLRELTRLDRLLAAAVEGPSDGATRGGTEDPEALGAAQKALQERLAAIEAALSDRARGAIEDAQGDALKRGVARRIEDLLSLPLATSLRLDLLESLVRLGAVPDKSKAKGHLVAPRPVEVIQRLQKDAKSQTNLKWPWSRAMEQAELETLLVEFADRDRAVSLGESVPRPADTIESKRRQLRKLSGSLAEYYRELPREINQAVGSNLPSAERRLRVLPFAADIPFRVNPVVQRHWSPPPVRGFDFADFPTSEPLVLDASTGWKDVEGTLAALGDFTGELRITVDYDPKKLEVVDHSPNDPVPVKPGDTKDVTFEEGQQTLRLRYRVRSAGLQPRATEKLVLKAEATGGLGESKSCSIVCAAPAPERVELVVWPAASPDNPVDDAALADNLPLISGTTVGAGGASTSAAHLQVSTFPGHVTSFTFKLKHDSRRKRKVSVQLLGVAETDPARIKQLRAMADSMVESNTDELLKLAANPRSTVAKLAAVKEMKLGEADTEGLAIEFPPFPPMPPPADGKDVKEPKDPARPPPSVVGGVVAIVNDLDDPRLGPWVTWIDLAPWAPWHYVEPKVKYDGQRQMVASVGLSASARPLDLRPIQVIWEQTPDIAQADIGAPEALLRRENDYRGQLEAQVGRNPRKQADVSLNVDGYPRAFVYRVPLDDRQQKGKDDRLTNLETIKIVRPLENDAFRPPDDKLNIKIQVSVPDSNFRSFRQSQGDRVEVGVDKTGDGTIDLLATSFTDRKHELTIAQIGADGRVAIDTTVSDLQFELPSPPLNKRTRLVAKLFLDGNPVKTDSVEVVFDQSRPTLEVAGSGPAVVHRGEKLLLQITADDRDSSGAELSGVNSVSYLVDKRKLDAEARKSPKKIENRNPQTGNYVLNFEPPDELALGPHNLLLWATDNVGLESTPQVVTFEVRDKRAMAEKTPAAAKKGTIKGQVTYSSASVANAKVAIVEGTGMTAVVKKSTTSDANGQFTFKDLEPGTYNLQAEGRARNGFRKAPATAVTVPTPAETVSVTIKLQ